MAELLYKNYYGQSNRGDLLRAVGYFDTVGDAFLDARAHYINGVGYYENDSVAEAYQEYLKALEIMEDHSMLSSKDLQLCQFYLLELSMLQVAVLLGTDYSSIRKRTKRLKEKIGDEDLYQ